MNTQSMSINNKADADQLRILIVEDNQDDMEAFVEMLYMKQKYAWDFKRATHLGEALRYLKEDIFDVIILDLNLPDSTGFGSLNKIREAKPNIPIVVMTGLNDEKIGVLTIRYGAQDYLFKGQITADLFLRSVNYAIERQHLEQVKDDLIAYVNHELSNPLSIIKEGLSQINDGIKGPINEEQRQFLEITLESIDRLSHIAQTLLESTRLEFGKIQLNQEKCDLVEIVKSLMVSFESVAAHQGVVINVNFSSDVVKIDADRDRIIQVLTNLLTNALKFTQKGFIEISVVDRGHMVECSIFDTGRGIAPEDLPKVFGKYQRFGQYQGSRIKGTGLGLFICKQLIELHDGRIWVESQAGHGSKFVFQLPKKEGE
jgi:signal transduction histidine kinase